MTTTRTLAAVIQDVEAGLKVARKKGPKRLARAYSALLDELAVEYLRRKSTVHAHMADLQQHQGQMLAALAALAELAP
jgi:hypothetical protein